MEIVAPAGNAEKLAYAWEYGADAAYIGLKRFSLRAKADNFHGEEWREIARLKEAYAARGTPKRLFCAVNISFHDSDIDNFLAERDYFARYPFDAFIVQDIGLAPILQREFPGVALHLSTQANCVNSRAARVYRDLGFSRVVLGREASLSEIRTIKDAVPDLEIECFAHGAMCIAYSGRCLMSAYLAGRSANAGSCSHSCRWDWRLAAEDFPAASGEREFALEERARPGEYFPVIEGDDFTALFSSKDLCMIDHLAEMRDAGVDSLKIEGRMKSIYYAAIVSRAYRKKLDALEGIIPESEAAPFAREIDKVAHREFCTGFYFSKEAANETTKGETDSPYLLAGTIGREYAGGFAAPECAPGGVRADRDDAVSPRGGTRRPKADDAPAPIAPACPPGFRDFEFVSMNKIDSGVPLEYLGPNALSIEDRDYTLIDALTGEIRAWVSHGHPCVIRTDKPIAERFLVRTPDPDYDPQAGAKPRNDSPESRVPRSMRA